MVLGVFDWCGFDGHVLGLVYDSCLWVLLWVGCEQIFWLGCFPGFGGGLLFCHYVLVLWEFCGFCGLMG